MKKEVREYLRKLGKKGGKRRLETMSKEERSERARAAVNARWAKKKEDASE